MIHHGNTPLCVCSLSCALCSLSCAFCSLSCALPFVLRFLLSVCMRASVCFHRKCSTTQHSRTSLSQSTTQHSRASLSGAFVMAALMNSRVCNPTDCTYPTNPFDPTHPTHPTNPTNVQTLLTLLTLLILMPLFRTLPSCMPSLTATSGSSAQCFSWRDGHQPSYNPNKLRTVFLMARW
jgi:hypothetical protein